MDGDRIDHIFEFMEYNYLSDAQHDLVVKFEEDYERKGFLSVRQMEVLEDIFRQGNAR